MTNFQFNYTKKNGRNGSSKSQVNKNSRAIAQMQREEEKKYIDLGRVDVPTYTGAGIAPTVINGIAEGTGPGQRQGNRVTLKSWQFKYWFSPHTCVPGVGPPAVSCDTLTQMVRVIAVWFPGVGTATASDIELENVLENPRDILSHYKKNGKVNYDKIFDRTHRVEFAFSSQTASPTPEGRWSPLAGSDFYFTHMWKKSKIPTYNGPGLAPVKGVLCFYAICETSPTSIAPHTPQIQAPLGAFQVRSRLDWTDD